MTSVPFSGKILLPWLEDESLTPKTGNKERALALSREKYGSDKQYVEDKIAKFMETRFDKGMAIALEKRRELQNNNYLNKKEQ